MNLRRIILPLSFLLLTANLYAQWSKEDSLWIEDVKSGKIKIELNPETKKAIEEGRFLGTDAPDNQELLESPSRLPILREFMIMRPEDVEHDSIDFSTLPSSVFFLYEVPDSADKKSLVYVAPKKDYISMKLIPIGTSGVYISANTGDLNPIVKDGQSRGGAMGTVGYCFYAEGILRYIFMPSERAKMRNRKYATAWKYY